MAEKDEIVPNRDSLQTVPASVPGNKIFKSKTVLVLVPQTFQNSVISLLTLLLCRGRKKKTKKNYVARAQSLLYSLILLFGGVLLAVVVVVCVRP